MLAREYFTDAEMAATTTFKKVRKSKKPQGGGTENGNTKMRSRIIDDGN